MVNVVEQPLLGQLIVIVDDDASVRQALFRLLKSLGLDVATFGTVLEYLHSQSLVNTALLILDNKMPGMSGLDLQDVIRALHAPIPIIFITAHPNDELLARAHKLGAIGLLEKPFDDQALITLLDKALDLDKKYI